jgi:hypothetical protein
MPISEKKKQTGKERTSIHIHLDNTILDGGLDLFLRGTGTAVENEEPRERCLKKVVIGEITRTRAWGIYHPTSH